MAFALDLSSPSDSFSQQLRVSHSSSQQLTVFIYSPWDSSSCLGLLLLSWLLGEVESCQHEFLSCSGIPRSRGREGPGHPRSPGQPSLGLPVHAGCLPALRQASGFHLGFAFYFQTYMQKKHRHITALDHNEEKGGFRRVKLAPASGRNTNLHRVHRNILLKLNLS